MPRIKSMSISSSPPSRGARCNRRAGREFCRRRESNDAVQGELPRIMNPISPIFLSTVLGNHYFLLIVSSSVSTKSICVTFHLESDRLTQMRASNIIVLQLHRLSNVAQNRAPSGARTTPAYLRPNIVMHSFRKVLTFKECATVCDEPSAASDDSHQISRGAIWKIAAIGTAETSR